LKRFSWSTEKRQIKVLLFNDAILEIVRDFERKFPTFAGLVFVFAQ